MRDPLERVLLGTMRSHMARSTRVIFERDHDGTWTARLSSMRRAAASGGSIAQARKRMRALLVEDRRGDLDVVDEIRLPADGAAAADRVARARAALDEVEREAVTLLVRRLGLGTREASAALGISKKRVVHLAGEVADAEAEQKSARRTRTARVTR